MTCSRQVKPMEQHLANIHVAFQTVYLLQSFLENEMGSWMKTDGERCCGSFVVVVIITLITEANYDFNLLYDNFSILFSCCGMRTFGFNGNLCIRSCSSNTVLLYNLATDVSNRYNKKYDNIHQEVWIGVYEENPLLLDF